MENDIPKIDLPQDWVIGKLTDQDVGLLNLYRNYPCRLKAGIFVFCFGGEIEASINLANSKVTRGCFVTLLPGSIIQIHRIGEDLRIYFMGFSSDFISQPSVSKAIMDIHYVANERPVVRLKDEGLPILTDYFELLIKTSEYFSRTNLNRGLINHLFSGVYLGINAMYKAQQSNDPVTSKAEQISKEFTQLVMQNYTAQRSVAWYAKRLGITQAHLSTIIKQTTGKTCVEIITSMVIMDAKAQLKSTNLSVHDIAYSLNFTNMSFFGKYFKRHVGMGPLEYRNS